MRFSAGLSHSHGAGNQPSGVGDAGACNTRGAMHVYTRVYTFTSIRSHWTLSQSWDYLFFYRFSKINLELFFFYTGKPVHLTTACTFARQKKHVIKLRDARILPFSPVSSPWTPCQIANQNLHLNRIFLMYESGRPEGKEVLHSLTIRTKLHLKCDTTF